MKVFISYSTNDFTLVSRIADHIRPHSEVLYWDNNKVPGKEAWPLIFSWIDKSDLVLVVITDNTISRAMSVGQEVGHAKAKQKMIIPIVTPNVSETDLGFLSGIIYQRIEHDNPGPALQAVERVILSKKHAIESQQAIFLIFGVLGLILLASNE